MGENIFMSESFDEDAMFFDELFIAEDEKGPDNPTGNNPSISSPQSKQTNEKTGTFKKMSNYSLQKMEERAAAYIDHDLVKDSTRTNSDGWVNPSTELKKESSNDAVMDYRIELENYRGSSPTPEESKKPRRKKRNKKKKSGKLSEKTRQSKAYKIYASKVDCAFFKKGHCSKGSDCLFRHHRPSKKKILCKHYVYDACNKGRDCNYLHSEFPCKYFHTSAECFAKEKCRFSHEPLTYEMKKILHEYLNPEKKCETPKEHRVLLGDPTPELKESEQTKKWQEELKNLQLQKSIYTINIPTEKQKMPENVDSSSNSITRQSFYQDTFITPTSPALPSVVKQDESRLVSANEMSYISPQNGNSFNPSFFDYPMKESSDEITIKKEESEENSISLAKNLSSPLNSLSINKYANTDQDKSVTVCNKMCSDSEVYPELFSKVSNVPEPQNDNSQKETAETTTNNISSGENVEKISIDATQEILSCENGLHSDDNSKKPNALHSSRIKLKRKLFRDWKLKLKKEEIKAACENKRNEDSLIPWENPALVPIPEWPSLTEMLIKVDLKILDEKNVSKAKRAKRMAFYENLILEAYDSYQPIENDNAFETFDPLSKNLNCSQSSTQSNYNGSVKPLNVQNNCQNASVSEGNIHRNSKSIKRPFGISDMPILPFIKLEPNDAHVHSSPSKSVPNTKFPLLSIKNDSTLERSNSKVLPPTQELLLKYPGNKSVKTKFPFTLHSSSNFTECGPSKYVGSSNMTELHPVKEKFPVPPHSNSLSVKPSFIGELSHKIKEETTFNPLKSSSELPSPDSRSSDFVGKLLKNPLLAKSQKEVSPAHLETLEAKSLPTSSHLPKSISDPRMAQLHQSRTVVKTLQHHSQAKKDN